MAGKSAKPDKPKTPRKSNPRRSRNPKEDGAKGGATPDYDREKVSIHILTQMMIGRSVKSILEEDDGMPSRDSFYRWIAEDKSLADNYARAMRIRADSMFDEMLEIADDARNDWMEKEGVAGTYIVLDKEHFGRSKLRIETRQWQIMRMSPKVYGKDPDPESALPGELNTPDLPDGITMEDAARAYGDFIRGR